MRIEIELPEWCDDRNIYIHAGCELVAHRYYQHDWKIKTGRCSACGKCCEKTGCDFLEQDGKCGIVFQDYKSIIMRPFACSISAGPRKTIPECTEQFG